MHDGFGFWPYPDRAAGVPDPSRLSAASDLGRSSTEDRMGETGNKLITGIAPEVVIDDSTTSTVTTW